MGYRFSKAEKKESRNEVRFLFKKCFKNPLFSVVPFEIWRDLIVSNADLRSIALLPQTCKAFKELVDELQGCSFHLALAFRKECQIYLAAKCLFKCAKHDPKAMFHVGYAYFCDGWGFGRDLKKGVEWFKKSAEFGNPHAIALYSYSLMKGAGFVLDEELSNFWGAKALSSKNSFAVGFCYYEGIATTKDFEKAFNCFEKSAIEGDEFGQLCLGNCYFFGKGTEENEEKAMYWYLKSAEQGLCDSQRRVAGGKDAKLAEIWSKKMTHQLLRVKLHEQEEKKGKIRQFF